MPCVCQSHGSADHTHTAPHALFTSSLAPHPHAFTITGIQTRARGSISERNQIVLTGSLGTPKAGHATRRARDGQLFIARDHMRNLNRVRGPRKFPWPDRGTQRDGCGPRALLCPGLLQRDLRSAETECICCGMNELFGIGSAVRTVCS